MECLQDVLFRFFAGGSWAPPPFVGTLLLRRCLDRRIVAKKKTLKMVCLHCDVWIDLSLSLGIVLSLLWERERNLYISNNTGWRRWGIFVKKIEVRHFLGKSLWVGMCHRKASPGWYYLSHFFDRRDNGHEFHKNYGWDCQSSLNT